MATWAIESTAHNELEGVPYPVARARAGGQVLWGNAAWRAMALRSLRPDDLCGACGIVGPEADRLTAALNRAERSREPVTLELDAPNLGLERWCRVYLSPGAPGAVVATIMPLRRLPEAADGPDPDEFIAAYEYLSEGVVLLDDRMQIRIATGFTANFLGDPGVAYEGRPALERIHPDDRDIAVAGFAAILDRPGEQMVRDLRLADSRGGHRWVEVIATNLLEHPTVRGVLVMLRDIDGRKEAEQRAARFAHLLDASPDIIVLFDRDGAPLHANPAALRAAGHPEGSERRTRALQELIRRLSRQLPDTSPPALLEPWQGEVTLTDTDAQIRTYSVVVVDGQEQAFTACMGRDITDRKRLEAELAFRALHDPLTGLPNRAALLDRLARALRDQESADGYLAVMFLDLDNLKDVNDSVGHEVGDALLVEVARQLRSATRPADIVSRLGGDEFVAICPNLPTADSATEVAERLRLGITGRLVVDRTDVFLSASVGVTVVPPRRSIDVSATDDALRLLRDADAAMYDAKLRGRAQVARFTPDMHERARARLQLTAGLDSAVADGQLGVLYQPIVDATSGAVTGVEALLRWHHPERGLLRPDQFIDLAEETGLIVPVGAWALDRALADLAMWRRTVPDAARFSVNVNVSARQLAENGFADQVGAALLQHGLDSTALVIEVTESAFVHEVTEGSGVLDRLRALGVGVAIDDFGTGYSSLAYLRRFSVDQLKLDGSFVDDIDGSSVNAAIAHAVIELAHAMGMHVVAESVATAPQLDVLRRLGCDRVQGYLLGHPMSAVDLPGHLDRLRDGPRNLVPH